MIEKFKVVVEYFKKRKKVSALIAALFVAAYAAVALVGADETKIENVQDKCNAVAKLIGLDCGEAPPDKE